MQEYQAGIGNGSLMLNESRIIAKILLSNVERQELERLIREENVLQKRSLLTARKQAGLIKNRLQNVTPEIWEIIAESDIEKATQALLIAAVKHSSLLGDFLRRVVRRKWRQTEQVLTTRDWVNFLEECEQISPTLKTWSRSTRVKTGEVIFRILAEAGVIDNTRSKQLRSFRLAGELKDYLKDHGENYVLECLDWES